MATLKSLFANHPGINELENNVSNFITKKAVRNLEAYRCDATLPPSFCEYFRYPPMFSDSDGQGAATGTAGDENLLMTRESAWRYHIIGTQTIVMPVWDSTAVGGGLNIGMDQTNGDGVELAAGVTARSAFSLTAGTDAGYVEVDLTVEDVSGAAELAVGWRKCAAFTAAIDDYTDLAALNMQGGNVMIETILNNAATSSTDTTVDMADADQIRMRVEVSATGACTFKVGVLATPTANGPTATVPGTTATFTFDSGDEVMPFIYFKHGSDVAGAVNIQKIKCGYL